MKERMPEFPCGKKDYEMSRSETDEKAMQRTLEAMKQNRYHSKYSESTDLYSGKSL